MKKTFITLTLIATMALPVFANPESPVPVLLPPESGQFGIPVRDTTKIENAIKRLLGRKLSSGYQITEFSVDWANIRCLDATSLDISNNEDETATATPIGSCAVKVSANGVTAVFSINRRDSGYSVDALVVIEE